MPAENKIWAAARAIISCTAHPRKGQKEDVICWIWYGVSERVEANRKKWNADGNIDELKDFAEWGLILGEQVGKLQHACLERDVLAKM